MPHIKSLNEVLSFGISFQWEELFSRVKATSALETFGLLETPIMLQDLYTLRLLSKMSLFLWNDGDDLALVSHACLKRLNESTETLTFFNKKNRPQR